MERSFQYRVKVNGGEQRRQRTGSLERENLPVGEVEEEQTEIPAMQSEFEIYKMYIRLR